LVASNNLEVVMRSFVVSDVARLLGCNPKDISDLFYQRKLDVDRCPIVGGRRLVPEDYLPEIKAVLQATGRLSGSGEVTHA
jgi:hypothetical protein